MKRKELLPLLFVLLLAVAGITGVLVSGRSPLLGLDLQGGASVVLRPKGGEPSAESLSQARQIIRQRIDGLGVAEPDVTQQGRNIVIEVPGIEDKDRLLALVGQTATLRFRPVIGPLLPFDPKRPPVDPTDPAAAADPTASAGVPSSTREQDRPEATVVLPELGRDEDGELVEVRRYQLGPALADGTIIKTAAAQVNPQTAEWSVAFETTGSGAAKLDEIAAANVGKQVAIVLDGVVKSAPTFNTASFNGRGEISGSFTQRDAKDLALVLKYGSLPIELETQTSQTVSASLGQDSLRAGMIAGAVGLALVILYMVAYYRALGLVVLFGLALSGAFLYTVLTLMSANFGLSLSLSGATGVIVSVGVTVDSYIVYFERLKDEIRSGRTIRTSVDRSFQRAWHTILVANGTSFIGACILYFLAVGPVRGFALNLAIATVLDCFVAYFFTRPMVALLGRSRLFTQARYFGVARGLAARGVA